MIRNKHIHAGDLGMFDKGKMQVCVCVCVCVRARVRIPVFFAVLVGEGMT
jgi:hypothetical protein